MRISFLVPAAPHSFRDPHIAVTCLATHLNSHTHHTASIIDYAFHLKGWKSFLLRKIRQKRPEVIGITCTSPHLPLVISIIKELQPLNLPIILGGYYPSLLPEEALSTEGVSAICIGDAEETLVEYLDALEKGSPLKGIKGLWYKKENLLCKNPSRPFYPGFESLSHLDWSLWDDLGTYLKVNNSLPFLRNRGCASNCTFCSAPSLRARLCGSYVRNSAPKDYVEEISYQHSRHNFRYVICHDPNFIVSDLWIEEFCRLYSRSGLSLPFSIETRPDTLTRKAARSLRAAGCRLVRLGIESGSDHMRNTIYQKNLSRKQIAEAVRLCKSEGLSVIGYFILGGPGETRATMLESYNLARELRLDIASFATYKPIPGTKSYTQLLSRGGKILEKRWADSFNVLTGSLVDTPKLSAEDVKQFQARCNREFRLRYLLTSLKKRGLPFLFRLIAYSAKALLNGVEPSWLPFGWVTQLDNFGPARACQERPAQ
jgi:anaerobic magnesium-protoporphyrin IX monomethyl ester cyclase